ncbi:MAG: stage 0 sporulation family protein [Nitrospinae bacterium]|nr:stage 0 sporulation family protein [Nitrospinota bacterium]
MNNENQAEAGKDAVVEPSPVIFIVGIKFLGSGKVYPYLSGEGSLKVGEWVVVEIENGENFGMIAFAKHPLADKKAEAGSFKRILRKASPDDMERVQRNTELEREGYQICQEKIEERGLPMKLSRVEFSFDSQRATFYFTAEGRVDFRDLVRDLAHHFKTKIEMKQIGVRDEARIIGGCGPCGVKLCCASFLKDFEPVSIKMAKDQNLPLNPVKISGVCGRLMCCLVYEHEMYREARKKMPVCGVCVMTPNGQGTVEKVDLLQEKILVAYPDTEKKETMLFSEVTVVKNVPPPAQEKTQEKTSEKAPEKGSGRKEGQARHHGRRRP